MIRTLSLFAGIGGFDLGLERTGGFRIVGQCEIDPFCRAVLKKHWPEVWCHDDVTTLTAAAIAEQCGQIDCICGGFPCQPHSVAGNQKGEADPRNLWPQYRDLVRDLQPDWIIAENVPGIRTTMADKVIEDMEKAGYSCWPLVVGADDIGAPHRRKRVWFVAHRNSAPIREQSWRSSGQNREGQTVAGWSSQIMEHANSVGRQSEGNDDGRLTHGSTAWPARPGQPQYDWEEPRLANTEGARGQQSQDKADASTNERRGRDGLGGGCSYGMANSASEPGRCSRLSRESTDKGSVECEVGSAIAGLPVKLVRFANRSSLKAYGNAVVPQIVTAIGNAILSTLTTINPAPRKDERI